MFLTTLSSVIQKKKKKISKISKHAQVRLKITKVKIKMISSLNG